MKKIKTLSPNVVIENAQLKAVESILLKTLGFFERKVRRWFSKNYATPYLDTFKIPWEELLLHYYEGGLENRTFNEVFDLATTEYLPEFMKEAEGEDQEFANSLVKEQEATLNKKKAKEKQLAKATKAAQPMAPNASKVADKAQSIKKALDDTKPSEAQTKPKAMSLKFDDEGDPDNL